MTQIQLDWPQKSLLLRQRLVELPRRWLAFRAAATGFHLFFVEKVLSRLDVYPLLWECHLPPVSPEARAPAGLYRINFIALIQFQVRVAKSSLTEC